MQMHEYHGRKLSTPATPVPDPPLQSTPVASSTYERPTHFNVKHTTHGKKCVPQGSTVEAEFGKYILGPVSSPLVNILQFWEVRLL